ncbi:MAG: hypothetical protein J5884_02550 [Paludibacteraceae bacterium]|nr:hypothetical protein [Paludibacteraceae bacterium]
MAKKTYSIPQIGTTFLSATGIICAGSAVVTLGVTISSEEEDPGSGR